MRRLCWIGLSAMILASCGDDESGGEGETNNGTTNDDVENDEAAYEGWRVVLEGDEAVFELPDLEGSVLDAQKRGDTVQLNGLGSEVGSLLVTIVVGEEDLEATDYGPTLFSVDWEENDYRCVGGMEGVTVTFTATDPARGSYAGTLTCTPGQVMDESEFDVTLSGEFGENL